MLNAKPATTRHTDLAEAIMDTITEHSGGLSPVEILAIVAQVTGRMVAFQDARALTSEEVMEVVNVNFQAGNVEAVKQIETLGQRPN
ncbi:hypothetical protein DDZ14_16220 [Maritimibacter sp. 55A14]|uniref:hypothetical protein n=1 Tax=Maritimibacter sp. 55A14 TaxID=2174844 RepID=UPI000D61FFF8|nr:hypothetical protein [Maritimibacter sp. 55A14]PWE29985.1 hypothetical protein DDZ14_16220 [Maritimibacter sp. 55A14]